MLIAQALHVQQAINIVYKAYGYNIHSNENIMLISTILTPRQCAKQCRPLVVNACKRWWYKYFTTHKCDQQMSADSSMASQLEITLHTLFADAAPPPV